MRSRLARAIDWFSLRWVEGIAARPGNPRRIELARFGAAVAPASLARPELDFLNRVIGLDPVDRVEVPAIADWYRARDVRGWFEVWTDEDGSGGEWTALADALVRAGADVVGSVHVHASAPAGKAGPAAPANVTVSSVGPHDFATWAQTLLRGHGVDDAEIAEATDDLAHFLHEPGFVLFLARIDGEPAGAAALTIGEGTAYLANAATVPQMRGEGAQTALIAARLEHATAMGCDLAVSLTSAGNDASRRNLERAGLAVVATKTVLRFGAFTESGG